MSETYIIKMTIKKRQDHRPYHIHRHIWQNHKCIAVILTKVPLWSFNKITVTPWFHQTHRDSKHAETYFLIGPSNKLDHFKESKFSCIFNWL